MFAGKPLVHFGSRRTLACNASTTVRSPVQLDASVKMGRRNRKDQANDSETSDR
jgi:hypothetical protein